MERVYEITFNFQETHKNELINYLITTNIKLEVNNQETGQLKKKKISSINVDINRENQINEHINIEIL